MVKILNYKILGTALKSLSDACFKADEQQRNGETIAIIKGEKSLLISIRIVSYILHQAANPARLFYLFTFLPLYSFIFLPFYLFTFLPLKIFLPFYLFTFLPFNVPCFTQPFCTFAYEKTRSMIPRDYRTEFRLAEGIPIPKQSRNIPETIPKDR